MSFGRAAFNPSSGESVPRLIGVILAGCGGSAPTKTLYVWLFFPPYNLSPICIRALCGKTDDVILFGKAVSRKCISPSITRLLVTLNISAEAPLRLQ